MTTISDYVSSIEFSIDKIKLQPDALRKLAKLDEAAYRIEEESKASQQPEPVECPA